MKKFLCLLAVVCTLSLQATTHTQDGFTDEICYQVDVGSECSSISVDHQTDQLYYKQASVPTQFNQLAIVQETTFIPPCPVSGQAKYRLCCSTFIGNSYAVLHGNLQFRHSPPKLC